MQEKLIESANKRRLETIFNGARSIASAVHRITVFIVVGFGVLVCLIILLVWGLFELIFSLLGME